MTTTEALKPCAHCGGTNLNQFKRYYGGNSPSVLDMAQCLGCLAEAPIAAWNRRATAGIEQQGENVCYGKCHIIGCNYPEGGCDGSCG